MKKHRLGRTNYGEKVHILTNPVTSVGVNNAIVPAALHLYTSACGQVCRSYSSYSDPLLLMPLCKACEQIERKRQCHSGLSIIARNVPQP